MTRLTGITVRAASRQPVGVGGYMEAAVSLAFHVEEGDPVIDGLTDHVGAELEAAFQKLWARIEGAPDARRPSTARKA